MPNLCHSYCSVEQEHDQEPTYADIGIMQQQNRQEEQIVKEEESDVEVEYKQVRISKPPCQSEPAVEDLYAKICKVRWCEQFSKTAFTKNYKSGVRCVEEIKERCQRSLHLL